MAKSLTQTQKELNKANAINEIHLAAVEFKNNVVGKKFLYVFDNRYIEVSFKKGNFKHLTGVDTKLSANDFYKYAVKGTLKKTHIFFSSNHPYALYEKKVKHIQDISKLAKSQSVMLEDIKTGTTTFKFGTTDLYFTLLMEHEYDTAGNAKSECYIVKSLRDEDCFDKASGYFLVTNVFVKDSNDKKYSNILYSENNILPNELEEKIDDCIKSQFIFK